MADSYRSTDRLRDTGQRESDYLLVGRSTIKYCTDNIFIFLWRSKHNGFDLWPLISIWVFLTLKVHCEYSQVPASLGREAVEEYLVQVFDLDACHQINWFRFKILALNCLMKLGDFRLYLRCFSKPVRVLRRNRTDVTGDIERGALENLLTHQRLHWGGVQTVLKSKISEQASCRLPTSSSRV